MVDETRVLRLLRAVTDDLAVLRSAATDGPQQRADPLWLRGVKYTFITAIEACVDVAQHLCAAEGWGRPGDNAEGRGAWPARRSRRGSGEPSASKAGLPSG